MLQNVLQNLAFAFYRTLAFGFYRTFAGVGSIEPGLGSTERVLGSAEPCWGSIKLFVCGLYIEPCVGSMKPFLWVLQNLGLGSIEPLLRIL